MELNMTKIMKFVIQLSVVLSLLENLVTSNVTIKETLTTDISTVLYEDTSSIQTTLVNLDICKDNNSCLSSLSEINVTTVAPTNQTKTTVSQATGNASSGSILSPTEIAPINKKHATVSGAKMCVCDLIINYCDLNCCCDKDCSSNDKMVFDHCEEDFHHYDTRFCDYTKHTYINNTLHESQINQNGLFCIVRTNLPPTYIVQQKYPLKSLHDAEDQKINKYFWPVIPDYAVTSFSNHKYTYGKPIWIIRDDIVETFQFFKSFITNNCFIKENIKYLVDVKSHCQQTKIDAENDQLKAGSYFSNILIIAKPELFNVSLYKKKNSFKDCPKNICLRVNTKICKNYFENCVNVSNSTNRGVSCNFNETNKMLLCNNLVNQVKYILYHNGTDGIVKADLFLIQKNISCNCSKVSFFQNFEVNFIWSNHTLNYSSHLSGNPGYLIGKPILTANLISETVHSKNNNSSQNNTNYKHKLKLFRNPSDFSSNFLVLPNIVNGDCILNKNKYIPLEFGFNMYAKCKMNEFFLNNKNFSAKDICVKIQTFVFKYWSLNNITNNTLNNKLIGQFGNANIYNNADWSKVMFKNDLEEVINKTWGEFDNKRKTVKCGNITTLLIIEIYHSRVDFKEVLNQEKILATTYQFSNFQNITFTLPLQDNYFNFSVKIQFQVMFFDITKKKIKKIVEPPSLSIKLPYDFFYPFVKLDNHSVKNSFLVHLIVVHFIFLTVF